MFFPLNTSFIYRINNFWNYPLEGCKWVTIPVCTSAGLQELYCADWRRGNRRLGGAVHMVELSPLGVARDRVPFQLGACICVNGAGWALGACRWRRHRPSGCRKAIVRSSDRARSTNREPTGRQQSFTLYALGAL